MFAAAVATLLPYVAFTGDFHLDSLRPIGWVNLLIIGIVHTGITFCLYFSALKNIPGQEAAILSYMDPLVAVAVSVFLLGEDFTIPQMIGSALILGFTLYNEITEN